MVLLELTSAEIKAFLIAAAITIGIVLFARVLYRQYYSQRKE